MVNCYNPHAFNFIMKKDTTFIFYPCYYGIGG